MNEKMTRTSPATAPRTRRRAAVRDLAPKNTTTVKGGWTLDSAYKSVSTAIKSFQDTQQTVVKNFSG